MQIISQSGKRGAALAGVWRFATIAFTAATLVIATGFFTRPEGEASADVGQVVALGVCALFAGIAAFAEMETGGRAAREEERRLRARLLGHSFALSEKGSPSTYAAGRLLSMLTDSVERVTEFRQNYLGATIGSLLAPAAILIYMAVAIDPVVGIGGLIAMPLIPVLLGVFMKFFRKSSGANRRRRSELSAAYLDAIRNMSTIRLFNAGPRIERDLAEKGEANRRSIMKLLAGNQIVIIVVDGLCGLLLICLIAGLAMMRGASLSTAEALTIVLLTVLLLDPLSRVAGFFYIGMGGRAAQKAITRYLSGAGQSGGHPAGHAGEHPGGHPAGHPAERGEHPSAHRGGHPGAGATAEPSKTQLPQAQPAAEATAMVTETVMLELETSGGVVARNVSFDYGRAKVLDGVDLTIRPGSKVALVGPSGAGKSTLFNLLRGALALQSGQIAVGSARASRGKPGELRRECAVVAQNTWLFTGTVADNVRMAAPGASDEEIWRALDAAQVGEDVRAMPEGINTYLGEDSALISGGQAQRIALARALASGRRILFLDEATSQIDIESEARIIAALRDLPADWTVLMVSHRHSLLEIADEIYELRAGEPGIRRLAGGAENASAGAHNEKRGERHE